MLDECDKYIPDLVVGLLGVCREDWLVDNCGSGTKLMTSLAYPQADYNVDDTNEVKRSLS